MAKVDVTPTLTDLDGAPVISQTKAVCEACGQATEEEHLTLRLAINRALLAQFRDEVGKLDAEKSLERYRLATKVHDEDAPDLSVAERKLIMDLVLKTYGPLIYGRVVDALED